MPQIALSRSPGANFEAQPDPATVSVRRGVLIPIMVPLKSNKNVGLLNPSLISLLVLIESVQRLFLNN